MSKHPDGKIEGDVVKIGEIAVDGDLKRNPGIGQSKGTAAGDPEDLEADSTSEGDVANETTRQGGVDPDHMGRTNK